MVTPCKIFAFCAVYLLLLDRGDGVITLPPYRRKAYNNNFNILKERGFFTCPQDRFSFISQDFEEIMNTINSPNVTLFRECKSKFLLTNYFVKYEDIWSECGKYGMLPASFNTLAELECVNKAYIKNKGPKVLEPKIFYLTAIIDINGTNNFKSCVTGKETPRKYWAHLDPNNLSQEESCASYNLSGLIYGLMDMECSYSSHRVICEYNKDTKKYVRTLNNVTSMMSTLIPPVTSVNNNNVTEQKNNNLNFCDKLDLEIKDCKLKTIKEEGFDQVMRKLSAILSTLKKRKIKSEDTISLIDEK